MAEACRQPRHELVAIFPGSWIDANFYIWIGHRDDHRAWSQLADARDALDEASGVEPADSGAGARGSADCRRQRLVLVVRRRPLVGARSGVRRPVPAAPAQRLSAAGAADSRGAVRQQHLDGRTARRPRRRRRRSSPRRSTARRRAISSGWAPARSRFATSPARCIGPTASRGCSTQVQFGFDREWLYVRLDAGRPVSDLLADGYQFAVTFLQPDGRAVHDPAGARPAGRELSGPARRGSDLGRARRRRRAVAAGTVIEAALPLSDLGVTAGAPLSFTVAVYDPGHNEVERQPGQPAGGADGSRRTVRSAQLERVTVDAADAPGGAVVGRCRPVDLSRASGELTGRPNSRVESHDRPAAASGVVAELPMRQHQVRPRIERCGRRHRRERCGSWQRGRRLAGPGLGSTAGWGFLRL